MLAYIISKTGSVIARLDTDLKSGSKVTYSYNRVEENINANREFNLVNAKNGKISRAKKYTKDDYLYNGCLPMATEINEGEFYLESLYQEED